MVILKELSIIFAILFTGEFINKFFALVLPGNVIGMMILFFLMILGIVKLKDIEKVSDFLLDNLTFFFIPAGVGIMKYYNLLQGKVVEFIALIFISTVLVMVFTGHTIQIFQKVIKNGSNNK